MPFVTLDDARLFYRLEGAPGAPVLMFSHSLGTDHQMWAPQAADLLPHFRVLRYDARGHGASDASPGEYPIELLSRDALALADRLDIARFALCGLSMGGAVGQWIALHAPERLTQLVLANTSPNFVPKSKWDERINAVKKGGTAAIADLAMPRFFTAQTLAQGNPQVSGIRSVLLGTDAGGYIGCCAALRDFDTTREVQKIKTPTLVIGGDFDVSTPWEGHGEVLAREIPGAKAVRLPAAHLSNLERPRSFTAALLNFLRPPDHSAQGSTVDDLLQAGDRIRRAVLGDSHVDRALAGTNDFNRDFQSLITRYAWGTIWTRPLLDHRTRRLLVLATMAALGRWEEFRMHLRAGLAHELEPCDLKEVLLQTAIYAGVPAANTGFHIAQEVLAESTK